MSLGHHQHQNSPHSSQKQDGVNQPQLLRSIWRQSELFCSFRAERNYLCILTINNDEVTQDQNHGVAGENKVTTVDVVPVDAQSKPGHDLDDPVENLGAGYRVVKLCVAVILGVRRGKNGDNHSDGSVSVKEANNDTNTTD